MTMMDGFLFGIGLIGAVLACGVFIVVVSAITSAILSVLDGNKDNKE